MKISAKLRFYSESVRQNLAVWYVDGTGTKEKTEVPKEGREATQRLMEWAEVGHQERDFGSTISDFAVKLDLG